MRIGLIARNLRIARNVSITGITRVVKIAVAVLDVPVSLIARIVSIVSIAAD